MQEKLKFILIGIIIGAVALYLLLKILSKILLRGNSKLAEELKDTFKNEQIPLKECPFCGEHHQQLVRDEVDGEEFYKMECSMSSGGCGCSTGWVNHSIEAVLLWNARPENYAAARNRKN